MTEDPIMGTYVRGQLALADIDLSTPLNTWLDAVYAVWANAPHKVLAELHKQMVQKSAMLRPEDARESWGVRPEHRAMAGTLGQGPGLEAGTHAGKAPVAKRSPLRRTPIPRGGP